jgi:hypothetical protein
MHVRNRSNTEYYWHSATLEYEHIEDFVMHVDTEAELRFRQRFASHTQSRMSKVMLATGLLVLLPNVSVVRAPRTLSKWLFGT